MEFFTLNTGAKMPLEGFGVFQIPDPTQCEQVVYDAIKTGYRWVRFDQLKNTSPFSKAFQEGVVEPFSRMFSGHVKELSYACEKLGGKKLTWSDAGYELKAFECIPVRFLFWDGDDEFPAQGNLLFDASATDFIHGESVVTIAAIGLDRIAKLAGVPMDRSAFPIF